MAIATDRLSDKAEAALPGADGERLVSERRSGDTGPLVSILICVYNPGAYFRPSLLSILNQSYRKLDIVIIDDGSTDGCIEAAQDLLQEPRVRVFRQENAGQPAALNRALELVCGEFVAIHDADDISHPRRIERELQVLAANPHLGAVFCGDELILNDRWMAPLSRAKDEHECRHDIERMRMPAHDPTAMYRTACLAGMRFDVSLPGVQSLDFVLRFGERYPVRVLGDCLYGYRIHSASVTKRDPRLRDRLVERTLRAACERRGLQFEQVLPPDRSRPTTLDNSLYVHFIESVIDQRSAGKRFGALITGLQCVQFGPLQRHYYKALVYALLPEPICRLLRRRVADAELIR